MMKHFDLCIYSCKLVLTLSFDNAKSQKLPSFDCLRKVLTVYSIDLGLTVAGLALNSSASPFIRLQACVIKPDDFFLL